VRIPTLLVNIIQKIRCILPFQVQCLFSNVLTSSSTKLEAIGFRQTGSFREKLIELAINRSHISGEREFGQIKKPITVITGAASGIGRALAEVLGRRGHSLLLIDKNEITGDLTESTSLVLTKQLDLTTADAASSLFKYLEDNKLMVDLLFNNAGVGYKGPLFMQSEDQIKKMIELNCLAVTNLCDKALKKMLIQGFGTIVNIGSSSSFQPLPYMAVYAATKAYVRILSLSLMGEITSLDQKAIKIHHINPSGTLTNFQNSAGVKVSERGKLMTPDDTALQIVDMVFSGRSYGTVGISGQVMELIARLISIRLQVWIWTKLMQKLR